MLLLKFYKTIGFSYGKQIPSFCVLQETIRRFTVTATNCCAKTAPTSEKNDYIQAVIQKYESKLVYNSIIEKRRMKLGYKRNMAVMIRKKRGVERIQNAMECIEPLPITLKYLEGSECQQLETNSNEVEYENEPEKLTQFPYDDSYNLDENDDFMNHHDDLDEEDTVAGEIRGRHEISKDMKNWMTAYDNYENDMVEDIELSDDWSINYGTPNPNSKISDVPCGGCGALLHCKDTAIPGYIPSEIFQNSWKRGAASLEAIICQRCYFLKEHNLALQVRVSPEDYPKVLASIRDKNALVVVMVDLTDFPCSIWPGIADIFGPKKPIVVVGNKVDLLPKDGNKFLSHVRQTLLNYTKLSGFGTSNILDVALISAKTGYGIENLITSLQSIWKHKGDVYIVGCTNVGKSSLFNALIQSDYCKIQATDLIQRATTSLWPGTTLNLLKFPIMRPSGYRLYLRHQRLKMLEKTSAAEQQYRSEQLKTNNSVQYATLIGHIGQSLSMAKDEDEFKDRFSIQGHSNASGKFKMGINEKHPDYAFSRWCFDTPGVVQPDQILNLLTVEELMITLPKQLIRPETFLVKPGTTLFIGGLARLDYLNGPGAIRLTVFRSNDLPITICQLEVAEEIYENFLGTELFHVPMNGSDRLSKWPGLESSEPFNITGTDRKLSSKDVVLSSAGWIAINCMPNTDYGFKAWTPEKRGIHLRDCLLPNAVNLRGDKIRYSVAYKSHKFI